MYTFFSRYWRLIVVAIFVALLSYVLLFRGLGTLTGGYSQTEVTSLHQSRSLRVIYDDPANAPYKLLVWAQLKFGEQGLITTRIAAASLAIFVAVLFYWVALHWYSKRVAFLASVLFISSSGFLHAGRYGTGLILQMATLLLISCVLLYMRTRHDRLIAYLLAGLLAICLYIPGFIWFEIIGLIVMRDYVRQLLKKLGPVHTILVSCLFLVIVAPLLWVGMHHLALFRTLAGLPATIPSLSTLFYNTIHLASSVIWRGYWPPEYWLYRAPLLNVAETILLFAGLFVLFKRPILRQNFFLIGTIVVSSLLIILGGSVSITMLVPLVYLVIAGGIYYLFDQWLTVFPRNPVARTTGLVFVFLLATFSALYHLQAYYTAWPNAPETKRVYTITIKPGD